jgi:membrane fusion protein (multidrug efflux system)
MIKKGALLVPQRAVMEIQGSYQIAVVVPDNTIQIKPVKVSERIDNLWVIDEGLSPGEKVVIEGVQKVQPGMKVHPRPFDVKTGSVTLRNQDTVSQSSFQPHPSYILKKTRKG